MMFTQFGEVSACWVSPLEQRGKERAYVRFHRPESAQNALQACNAGQVFLDGVKVDAVWRTAAARMQDSRDFDAKGSNLFTSRDLMGDRPPREDDRDRDRDRDRRKERERA